MDKIKTSKVWSTLEWINCAIYSSNGILYSSESEESAAIHDM